MEYSSTFGKGIDLMAKQEKIGDVFSIELSNGQYGFGQILWKKGLKLRIGIFNSISDSNSINAEALNDVGFIIIENTVRTFFKLKRWKVIVNLPFEEQDSKLLYKVHTPTGISLMDIEGNLIGEGAEQNMEELEYDKSYSPISFSRAIDVCNKIIEYDAYYEKMLRTS